MIGITKDHRSVLQIGIQTVICNNVRTTKSVNQRSIQWDTEISIRQDRDTDTDTDTETDTDTDTQK